jgi:uncharacterized ferritin-like protein (DUF455 family)
MPPSTPAEPSLREQALTALCLSDPAAKADAAHALWLRWSHWPDDATRLQATAPELHLSPPEDLALPGRPASPALVAPMSVPHRSPFTPEGLAALLHAITHIEFNAINLALDAVWRFNGMPIGFYRDWLRVADEEATHFGLLRAHLQSLGFDYGDFPAHDGLWEMCVKTQHDITARMALVPRTLEARGLDATPLIQARLRKVNTPEARRAIDILDVILRDEIGHVAIGNRWYGWLCQQQGLEPFAHYRVLARTHSAPRLKPPFHLAARLSAGFTQQEIDDLLNA